MRPAKHPAQPIKVAEQRGQRHRGIPGGGKAPLGFKLRGLSINLQLPVLLNTQGQGSFAPRARLFGADGENKAGGEEMDPRSPRNHRARGGGKERASLPSSLCPLQKEGALDARLGFETKS